ncbi:MAG TPA: DUF3307 domain-containing protein [Thermotogota bacterium]|nr:DUF3307 domain-containing protein [Thermotogota bacterium]HRW35211.1 DUF3307 domain-containing protein [Thermotogota bacterium]
MTAFLLALLAHALSDFVFQKENRVEAKKRGLFKAFFLHALSVGLFTYIFLLPYRGLNPLVFALFVFLIHLLIDYGKFGVDKILEKGHRSSKPLTFILDQLLHIFSLLILTDMIQLIKRPFFVEFVKQNPSIDLYLITIIVYLFVLFGGAYFVRLLLDIFPSTEKQEVENASKGKLIGVLERALLLTLWITGNTGGVAIVLTAKSIARFKEFDNKDFAEYYLIGTLTSTLIAILGGMFVQVFL